MGALLALSSGGFAVYEPWAVGPGMPEAMNGMGQMVGSASYMHDPVGRAVLWETTAGEVRQLADPTSVAVDVNASTYVVLQGTRPQLWHDGQYADLGATTARAVNNLNQVVTGFGIWDNGSTRSIGGISGSDINDLGQVAGNLYGTGAVMWDAGTITAVGPPGALDSEAHGINESGQVVGQADRPDRYGRGFLWDGVESVILAALGDKHASAEAINDLAQIVGWSDTPAGDRHAVLWEDGAIADLNDLLTEPFPYTLVEAADINNRGQIACRAEDASGGSWAVLLNPIAEPGTVLLLAAGGAAAALRRRRSG